MHLQPLIDGKVKGPQPTWWTGKNIRHIGHFDEWVVMNLVHTSRYIQSNPPKSNRVMGWSPSVIFHGTWFPSELLKRPSPYPMTSAVRKTHVGGTKLSVILFKRSDLLYVLIHDERMLLRLYYLNHSALTELSSSDLLQLNECLEQTFAKSRIGLRQLNSLEHLMRSLITKVID